MRTLKPEIAVKSLVIEITDENLPALIRDTSVVVDAIDDWRNRFLINETCVKQRLPLVHSGIFDIYIQIIAVIPGKGTLSSLFTP